MTDNIKNKVDSIDKSKLNAKTKDIFEQIIKGLRSKDTKISDKSEELLDKLISSAKAKNSDIFVAEKTSKANKEDSNAKVKSRRQQLFDAIQNDPKLSGFNKFQSIIEIDAERVALPKGKRVSKKGWKNQYGKSTGGHTYYETRENRMDRIAPITRSSTPKPWLKYGGEIEEGKYAIVVEDKNGNEKLANTKNSMDEAMAYATLKKNVIGRNGIVKVYNDEKECVYKSFYEDGGYMAKGGELPNQDNLYVLMMLVKGSLFGTLVNGEVYSKKEADLTKQYYEKKDGDKWDIKIFTVKEILGRETLDKNSKNNILINYEAKKEFINHRIKLDKEYGFEPNWQEYEDGGEMDDSEGVDLFEDYEDQPEEVSAILSKYEQEDNNYDTLNDLLAELNHIGYTFEFGLDAEPYDLRKIGQIGKSEYYAEGGQLGTINTELINVKNNIMGTTTLEMKIKGMRKPQNFIVYPISSEQANKPIMIQSDTRFGFLDLSTGEGLMSQSHANGAYSYHFQTDKKVHFKLSETDVQRIKSDLSKKAGSKVGNSVIFSDNSGANMMAKGGEIMELAKFKVDNPNWTNEELLNGYNRAKFNLREFEMGYLKPSKVIGTGYKSSAIAKKLAKQYCEDQVEIYKTALELRGVMAEGGKLDESTKMVLSQNKAIAHHTEELKNALKKDPNVEPWVIGKVGRAETDISDVTHYLDGRSEYRNGGTIGEGRYIIYYEDPTRFRKKRKVASFDSYEKAKEELKKLKYQNEDIDYSIGNKSMFEEKMLSTTFAKGGKLTQGDINKEVNQNIEQYLRGLDKSEQLYVLREIFKEALVDANFGEFQDKVDEIFKGAKKFVIVTNAQETEQLLFDVGQQVAKSCTWDRFKIQEAMQYTCSMNGYGMIASKISDIYSQNSKKLSYVAKNKVKYFLIKNEGKSKTFNTIYDIYESKDVLNGANVLENGGELSDYKYYAKSKVIIIGIDGKPIDKVNGAWVKKTATPIGEVEKTEILDIDSWDDFLSKNKKYPNNPSTANMMTLKEFREKLPDVYNIFWGDKGVVYKAKYDQYSDRFKYFKNGRRNSTDKKTIEGAYKHYVYFMEQGKDMTNPTNRFEQGGRLGFEGLSEKVAKKYEGMKVPSKYQKEYGKTYSKEEAKEVGNKVAYSVHKKQGKMAEGGETEWFDYSKSNLKKLPNNLDKYFTKTANTKRLRMLSIEPIRAREKGVINANKFMQKAYDGEMEKRKPITVKKVGGKYQIVDGNSTFANAKFSGWKFIYADIVKKDMPNRKESIFEIAKRIRKEGEAWKDSLQRAKKML